MKRKPKKQKRSKVNVVTRRFFLKCGKCQFLLCSKLWNLQTNYKKKNENNIHDIEK